MTLALPETLQRSRDIVEPALRAAVDRLDPASRNIARYHFGWCDADGRAASASGGKAMRPALALLSGRAVGGSELDALAGAVAVELVHNFSLLHDDVMDGDLERRHRPTVWALFGASSAILCGDALLALASDVLFDSRSSRSIDAARMLGVATQALIRGQFADLDFERRCDVGVHECLDMAAGKTGALLACSSAIGAVLAGADNASVIALSAYGAELGLAFQLIDDVLGIWGDSRATGKPVGSDLRARKKSLPVTYALEHGGAAGRRLSDWLATEGPDTDDDIARAAALVEEGGGRAWALAEAHGRLALGESALDQAPLAAQARDELVLLGRFVVERDS